MKKGVDYTGVAIVYLCHDGKGKFLMARRNAKTRDEHGCWDTGGGGLEFGETVEDTLKKEIREEYCCDVLKYEFLGFRDVHRTHKGTATHWVTLDFKVLVDPDQAKIGEPDKFDEIGWFSLDALPNNLHSQLPGIIEKYRNSLTS
jgi:8-oxo-dGTP pyrophosphatase MutT (NUDIX family)